MECWEWTGYRLPHQYGRILGREKKLIGAHQAAWVLVNGPIPHGLWVLHRCDNRACCNPAHLFLGTRLDNARDMVSKGRSRGPVAGMTHCKNGHAFTEENTAWERTTHSRGTKRRCRRCHADTEIRRYHRRRVSNEPRQ